MKPTHKVYIQNDKTGDLECFGCRIVEKGDSTSKVETTEGEILKYATRRIIPIYDLDPVNYK